MNKKKLTVFTAMILVLVFCFGICIADENTLYVFGKEGAGDFDNDYLRRINPDFKWVGVDVDGNNDAKYMAMQMQTKNDCFDVYAVGYAYCGLTRLNEKGFCMDLSVFSQLKEIAGKYHPYIQQAIWSDGKLFAIPVNVSVSGWGYNKRIAEEMGLADSMPSTYSELFELLTWWLQEGCELYPDYEMVTGPGNYRKALCSSMIHDYVNYCTLTGRKMNFEDEIITKLIHELDSLDTDELDYREEQVAVGIAYEKPSLLIMDCNYSNLAANESDGMTPLKIGVTEDDTALIADIYCFAVNPKTQCADMAATYISTFLENLDEESRIALFCDESVQPIEEPDYEDNLEYVDLMRQNILENKELDEGERNEMLRENERERKQIEDGRWFISQEQIDNYLQLTSRMKVRCQNILERNTTTGALEIEEAIRKFGNRETTTEEFLREANHVLNMILEEDV